MSETLLEMGGACSCCDLQPTRSQEINIASPKSKLSLLALNSLSSPKHLNPEAELQARIKQLQMVNSNKMLKLKVLNSGNLPKGSVFTIKPQGLEDSLREIKDGYVFFGCLRKSENEIINDIVIPLNDSELTITQQGRNFMIFYNVEKDLFFLKDLGKGFSAFVKLTYSMVIKNNWMINIGESFLVFSIEAMHLSPPRLTIKKFSGNEEGNIKSYEASEYVSAQITIGRGRSCDIEIEDYLLSKVQCCIYYDMMAGWTIADGDTLAQKESTNGTWIYVAEEIELTHGMVFKAYQTLFQVRIT